MKFNILRFLETTHPLKFICYGLFMVSVGLNIMQYSRNTKLLKRVNENHSIQIIFVPKDQPYFIPHIEQPDNLFTSIQGGVKVSTTISELYKQVVVDRPATLKVD